ncbi:MAG: Wzz/FepE/Etk N-terminal domain-containing protein [Paracoccaceae bacterium]
MADTSSERSNEVDLFELLYVVIQERITVLAVMLLALLLGVLFVFAVPQKYVADLTIRPVLVDEIGKYTDLNSAVDFRENTDTSLKTVSAERFLDFFGGALLGAEPVRAALQAESSAFAALADDPEGQRELIEDVLNGFRVSVPDPATVEFGVLDWVIEVETRNVDEMGRVVLAALDYARETTRSAVVGQIGSIRDAREREVSLALEDAIRELELAVYGYEVQQEQRLAFLREQAGIARALDIRDRAFEARAGADAVVVSVEAAASTADVAGDSPLPYYLRGYLAIEEEIGALEARDSDDVARYIPTANALRVKIRELETDRSVERIDAALAASPLSGDDFVAARYNTTLLIFERAMSTPVILVVSVFLGGVAGILFVFARHGIRRFRERKQTA